MATLAGLEPLRATAGKDSALQAEIRKRPPESLHHECESLRVALAASPGCLVFHWLAAQPITHIAVERRIENASQSRPAPPERAGFCPQPTSDFREER
jgi:hypothetical protein